MLTAIGKPNMSDRVTSLVQLHEATGRPAQAAEWRKFLGTIPGPAPPLPAR